MGIKSIGAIAAVVVIAGSYVAGWLPERRARMAAEEQVVALEEQLAGAQARLRVGELLGQALTLKEVAARRDYGQAQELSSVFFDAVRQEEMVTTDSALRGALGSALAGRDAVTAALARSEPAVTETLHDVELQFRRALMFVMPPGPVPTNP
jgi:hypothetical protein